MLKIAISFFPAFKETRLFSLKGETVPFPAPLAEKDQVNNRKAYVTI